MYVIDNTIVYIETLNVNCMINTEKTFQNFVNFTIVKPMFFCDIIHWKNVFQIEYNINVAES